MSTLERAHEVVGHCGLANIVSALCAAPAYLRATMEPNTVIRVVIPLPNLRQSPKQA